MLYEVISQPSVFLWLALGGFAAGILFDLRTIFLLFFKKKNVVSQILLFFSSFLALFLCFFLNLKTNYGEFRIFPVFAFILAFAVERFFAQNFLAKPLSKCYNKLKGKLDEKRRRNEAAQPTEQQK